jgi:hypothetical protein
MAAKKSESNRPNKSAFVRNLPADLSAKEVVAKAKEAGLTLTEAYVYTIRSASKRGNDEPKRGPGRPKGSKSSATKAAPVNASLKDAEAQVMSWIIEHGAPAVSAMIENVKSKLRRLV